MLDYHSVDGRYQSHLEAAAKDSGFHISGSEKHTYEDDGEYGHEYFSR